MKGKNPLSAIIEQCFLKFEECQQISTMHKIEKKKNPTNQPTQLKAYNNKIQENTRFMGFVF